MKHVGFIFCFLLFSGSIIAQNTECNSVRTGAFKSVLNVDGVEIITMIYRGKDKQIEEVKEKGVKMEFDVTWTSPCTYQLSHPKMLKGSLPGISDKQVVYVKIIEVTKDMYKGEVTTNFSDGIAEFDFRIIK